MLLRIFVQEPSAPEREHRVSRPVLRVGSAKECDISLTAPGIAPHALTFQRDGETVRIIRKDVGRLSLGGKLLGSSDDSTWRAGTILELEDQVQLRFDLVAEAQAAVSKPVSRPQAETPTSPGTTATETGKAVPPSASAFSPKGIIQSIVLVIILAGVYLIISGDADRWLESGGTAQQVASAPALLAELNSKIQELEKAPASDKASQQFLTQMRDDLRKAYRFENSGSRGKALSLYRTMLARLMNRLPESQKSAASQKAVVPSGVESLFADPLDRKLAGFLVQQK